MAGLRIQNFASQNFGEVAEWLKAAVLKTVIGREVYLEFKSLPLRCFFPTRKTIKPKAIVLRKYRRETADSGESPASQSLIYLMVLCAKCSPFSLIPSKRDSWV